MSSIALFALITDESDLLTPAALKSAATYETASFPANFNVILSPSFASKPSFAIDIVALAAGVPAPSTQPSSLPPVPPVVV